jgi:DNA-binding NarL/FixJ family response regulator
METLPPRVVLADGDLFARNVVRLSCHSRGVLVVGETSTFSELVQLCEVEQPTVAVIASDLTDGAVDDHVAAVLATGTRIVVMSEDRSPERITSLLGNGVSGYLSRDSSPDHVADAVEAVADGEAALHPVAAETVLNQWRLLRSEGSGRGLAQRVELTEREYDVLHAMADGLQTKAIARRLGVALKTVENHKIHIFDKLGVRTQAHAVSLAIGQGLLEHRRNAERKGEEVPTC